MLTPRARLLLPAEQQFKFTAALARREVTVWASDRSIHVLLLLDGAVIRTDRLGCPNTPYAAYCAAAHA